MSKPGKPQVLIPKRKVKFFRHVIISVELETYTVVQISSAVACLLKSR